MNSKTAKEKAIDYLRNETNLYDYEVGDTKEIEKAIDIAISLTQSSCEEKITYRDNVIDTINKELLKLQQENKVMKNKIFQDTENHKRFSRELKEQIEIYKEMLVHNKILSPDSIKRRGLKND